MKKVLSSITVILVLFTLAGCQSLGIGVPRGRVEYLTLPSPIPDEGTFETPAGERQMSVYLPPGYDEGGQDYPLFIVLHHYPDGDHETFLGKGYPKTGTAVGSVKIDKLADKLIHDGRARPMIIAMPDFSHSWTDNRFFLPYVADVVLPSLRSNFRVSSDRTDVALAGHYWSARESLDIIMENESAFGTAVLYSFCLVQPPVKRLIKKNYDVIYPVRFYAYYTKIETISYGAKYSDEMARKYLGFLQDFGAEIYEADFEEDHWEALPLQVEQSLEDIFN